MNSADVTFVARRDALIEAIEDVLQPQLLERPLSTAQHVSLQTAIAQYTVDILDAPRTSAEMPIRREDRTNRSSGIGRS